MCSDINAGEYSDLSIQKGAFLLRRLIYVKKIKRLEADFEMG